MTTEPTWQDEARRLYGFGPTAGGLSMRKIGVLLGRSITQVCIAVNPAYAERQRIDKRERQRKRYADDAHDRERRLLAAKARQQRGRKKR